MTAVADAGTAITRDEPRKTIRDSPYPDVAERPHGDRIGDLSLDNVYVLDAREGLARLPEGSVDCIVTSPPYWWMRDYQVPAVAWSDGTTAPLGLEPSFESYVEHIVEVLDAAKRVLKDTGTLWLNLGDAYVSGTRARRQGTLSHHRPETPEEQSKSAFRGLPKKTLCMIPERLAVRMLERGWILRNKIVWHKPNHLPVSTKDRFACGWEYVFLFVKSKRYFFDIDAVREPHETRVRTRSSTAVSRRPSRHVLGHQLPPNPQERCGMHPLGKNPGDCWSICTWGSRKPHPAAFPEALCERPIRAGCPPGGLVLDPFCGIGTACVVAKRLGRHYLGFDANGAYIARARERVATVRTAAVPPAMEESRAA